MKKAKTARIIEPIKDRQWHIHHIATFMLGLDKPKDAAQVQKDKLKTAPLSMLDMVF